MFIVVTLIILLGDAGNPKSLRARKGKFYFISIFEYAKLIEETHKNVLFCRLLVFIRRIKYKNHENCVYSA